MQLWDLVQLLCLIPIGFGGLTFHHLHWPLQESGKIGRPKFSNSVNCFSELSKTAASSPPKSGIFISLLQHHRLWGISVISEQQPWEILPSPTSDNICFCSWASVLLLTSVVSFVSIQTSGHSYLNIKWIQYVRYFSISYDTKTYLECFTFQITLAFNLTVIITENVS